MESYSGATRGNKRKLFHFLFMTMSVVLSPSQLRADQTYEDYDNNADLLDEVAKMYACKFAQPPSLPPSLRDGWAWNPSNEKEMEEFEADTFARQYPGNNLPDVVSPFDPYCETVLFNFLEDYGRQEDIVARCNSQARNMGQFLRRGAAYQGAQVSLPRIGSGVRSGRSKRSSTSARGQVLRNQGQLIEAYNYHTRQRTSVDRVSMTESLREYCKALGVRMDVRIGDYPNPHGYGAGACYNGNGTIIVKRQPKTLETLLNVGLAAFKMYAPLKAMDNANKRHEENVRRGMDHLADMGIPFGVGAGSAYGQYGYGYGGGGYGYGGGYGCMGGGFGYGGCANYGMPNGNGHYGVGLGLNFGAGGGGMSMGGIWGPNTGNSGYCPQGHCYGNGGVIVGGSPWMNGGGFCGTPPMNPYGPGCGGGSGGFFPGGYNPFSRAPASGGYYGNGVPQFNTGYGNGGYGFGNGGGGNPFPGPWGTANGGNGWNYGGQWGAGGQFGGAPFWGTNGNSWGSMNNMYAFSSPYQQYEAYVEAQGNKARTLANHARKKEQELRDASWSYNQAYMGAQSSAHNYNSEYGVTQPAGFSYYPPFQSQPVFGQQQPGFQGSAQFSFGQ